LKVLILGPLVHLVKVGLGSSRVLGTKSGKEESGMLECEVEVRSWPLWLNFEFCIWKSSLLRNSDDTVTSIFRWKVWGYISYGCMLRDRRKSLKGHIYLNYTENFTLYLTVNNHVLHYKRNRLMLYMEKPGIHSEIHIKTRKYGLLVQCWVSEFMVVDIVTTEALMAKYPHYLKHT
jgi:hypothetical protein